MRERKSRFLASIFVSTLVKSESLLYSTEISSMETKICSKTAQKSKTNQNLQKKWKNGQSRERNPMREALQSSRMPLYLKNEYIYGPRVKWA